MAKKTVAMVGSETLLGREIRDLLRSSDVEVDISLVASGEGDARVITEDDAEIVVMADLQSDAVTDATIVVLCGPEPSSHRTLEVIRSSRSKSHLVDATGALEEQPGALLRAPLAVPEHMERIEGAIDVIAHPAAIAVAKFLVRLGETGRLVRAVVTVFEPASERGQAGITELQRQTVALLSFKPLLKDVYDAQVSFNMLPAFGENAPKLLGDVEDRIERNLATLLSRATNAPMPSLRLLQAPVFHGYSISVWAEFGETVNAAALARQLAAEDIDVRTGDQEPPTNVGMAGQGGIAVGSIAADRNNPRACWFWVAADNLRITAENCVEVIRELVA